MHSISRQSSSRPDVTYEVSVMCNPSSNVFRLSTEYAGDNTHICMRCGQVKHSSGEITASLLGQQAFKPISVHFVNHNMITARPHIYVQMLPPGTPWYNGYYGNYLTFNTVTIHRHSASGFANTIYEKVCPCNSLRSISEYDHFLHQQGSSLLVLTFHYNYNE